MHPRPLTTTLFPYTTLFRSSQPRQYAWGRSQRLRQISRLEQARVTGAVKFAWSDQCNFPACAFCGAIVPQPPRELERATGKIPRSLCLKAICPARGRKDEEERTADVHRSAAADRHLEPSIEEIRQPWHRRILPVLNSAQQDDCGD